MQMKAPHLSDVGLCSLDKFIK